MSTSSRPALDPKQVPEVRPFPYAEANEVLHRAQNAGKLSTSDEELARREQAAREAGRQEGEARARTAFEQELARVRENLRTAVSEFSRQRGQYFEKVEAEVVQLALGIARKILHREAQVDHLLLAGIVRVALEKIQRGTRVTMRVPPQQISEFRGYFARYMEPAEVPDVVEDPALDLNHCVLETALGTTELGLEVQLKESEHGLMDLLAQRPRDAI